VYQWQYVKSGGLVVSTSIVNNGSQTIDRGGVASGDVIGADGATFVNGTDQTATVLSGGYLRVGSGGVDSGSTISSGGQEVVASGGSVAGVTLAGGTLEIQSGGTAGSSTIAFARIGSELKLDDASTFSGILAGFGQSDSIDLSNITFSGAMLVYSGTASSGTYTIDDGTHIASLNVLGPYIPGFHLADDGHGGTMVTVDPLSGTLIGLGGGLVPLIPPSVDPFIVPDVAATITALANASYRAGGFTDTFSFVGQGQLFGVFAEGGHDLAGNFMANRNGVTANLGLLAQGAALNFVSGAGVGGQTVAGDLPVSSGASLATPH
jgi:autotransporter passenger strand-loop-strand repeat protein